MTRQHPMEREDLGYVTTCCGGGGAAVAWPVCLRSFTSYVIQSRLSGCPQWHSGLVGVMSSTADIAPEKRLVRLALIAFLVDGSSTTGEYRYPLLL